MLPQQDVGTSGSDLRTVEPAEHLTGLHAITRLEQHLSQNAVGRSRHCDVQVVVVRHSPGHAVSMSQRLPRDRLTANLRCRQLLR